MYKLFGLTDNNERKSLVKQYLFLAFKPGKIENNSKKILSG